MNDFNEYAELARILQEHLGTDYNAKLRFDLKDLIHKVADREYFKGKDLIKKIYKVGVEQSQIDKMFGNPIQQIDKIIDETFEGKQ